LNWLTATELVRGFRDKSFSPVDVAKACLAQISTHDAEVNAMCLVDKDVTLNMALASEARWLKGVPLSRIDGVPTLIKDLVLVNGWPTRRGSKTVDINQPWEHDAPCVARLREAGCVFMGLTTTPEFGWKGVTDSPLTGITRNPWNLSKTPGGSSGGSSAALAAGYGALAVGTDGGGSIRIPAGFTGVFGLKPSFGRVPAWPLSPFGTVAHIGPMTRTVADSALMLNAIAQPDSRDWHALPFDDFDYLAALEAGVRGLRIAYSRNLGYVKVDPEVAALVEAAVKVLAELGAEIVDTEPGLSDPAECFRTIWWSGARFALGGLPDDKKSLIEPALQDVLQQAKSITVEDVFAANRSRGLLGSHMRQFMESFDALITPTLPIAAFDAGVLQPDDPDDTGKWVNWTPFSYPFNLTQQPAASVPCGFTSAGLPVGLHVIGKMFDDAAVLNVCAAYESATDFRKRRVAGF
jgi:aspartyl-tRNA(Asn)/glutamyl-tRNA(Gln) amidotransferase subunit A